MAVSGVYEHLYGTRDLDGELAYWRMLGFAPVQRGALDADGAHRLYGVGSRLRSVRLAHRATDRQGLIRLLAWDEPLGEGLRFTPPLAVGSRWSGFYTSDLLRVREAYLDDTAATGRDWRLSALNRLPLTGDTPSFSQPFVGIRETFVIGEQVRHAFLQRVGFDRPGFGTLAEGTPLPVTEASHANVVAPAGASYDFYVSALGLAEQTPPMHLDATMPAIRGSLQLQEGDAFTVVVLHVPGTVTSFLRWYVVDGPAPDARDRSRPGHLGLCAYSWRLEGEDVGERAERLAAGGAAVGEVGRNEFGEDSAVFTAPDGSAWVVVA